MRGKTLRSRRLKDTKTGTDLDRTLVYGNLSIR